jgi:crotonobetainyl-CoA:carnitine CoA-transferase CaiB-like acyl-CoA transferase
LRAALERSSIPTVVGITPHGLDGPYADRRESDLTLFGWSTRPHRHSIKGREPLRYAPFAGATQVGATAAAVGAAALRGAREDGQRRVADVAGVEALLGSVDTAFFPWAVSGAVQPRRPGQSAAAYPTGAYRCRDGYVVIVGRHEPAFSDLFRLLGRPELADDPRFRDPALAPQNFEEFLGLFQPWLDARTRYEVFHELQEMGMMVAPLLDVSEAAEDPQAKARDSYVSVDVAGGGTITLPGAPFRIADAATPAWQARPAPRLGEHTGEVLDELGYSRDEQIALFRAGVTL